jgi:hypothetical protein
MIEATELLCVIVQIDRVVAKHWVAPVFLVKIFAASPRIKEPEALSD